MNKDDLVKRAREHMAEAIDADRENREHALDDLQQLIGEGQWPENVRQEREAAGRPCLTINRLPQFLRQVTGDIRQLNPAIQILPGDEVANEDTAEIIAGLVRQIEYKSGASNIYEAAAESAAACGMGFWRIRADWEDDSSFTQEIRIERICNPFSVYFDPAARHPTRADADWCMVTESMDREAFQEAYPDAALIDAAHDAENDGLQHWSMDTSIVVAEYFWIETEEIDIGLMRDGTVVEKPVAALDIVRKRKAQRRTVMWAKITGKEVLEGPQEVASKHIPVVAVMGEELPVEDKVYRSSVIRHAKDPQRLYNYWRSAQTELIALQPKAPYVVTTKQVAGLEEFWNEANNANRPYLPYNPDPSAPAPQRATPPVSSQGMAQEIMTAAEDMKATTGIYDAGLGQRSNEQSGVAIRQRQMESDVSTSIYTDNLAQSIEHSGRIIVGMIPRVYDTHRFVRLMGEDGAQKQEQINGLQITQEGVMPINDLKSGRYDVRVSVGPNYSTRRQETAESMMQFIQALPNAAPMVMDLVAQNMDWPGADLIAKRLKKALPPGMVDPEDMSPEEQQAAQQAMQQQAEQMQLQQQAQMLEFAKLQAETQETAADAAHTQAETQKTQVEAAQAALELALQNGQINAAINQAVNAAVARALQMQGQMQQAQMMGPQY